MDVPSKLTFRLSRAVDIVRNHDFIQVYSHYDADGLSAASIVAKVLIRAGKEFRITIFTSLEEESVRVIKECAYDCILITDLGASYIKELEELNKSVIVLDHHVIHEDSDKVCYVNPHLVGIDGSSGACGATMAFLFGISMDPDNWDLVQIAFIGITGDKQHLRGISGLNLYLLNEGMKRNFITQCEGSLIPPGQISKSLFYSTEPYIRGISGNKVEVDVFLKSVHISGDKDLKTMTKNEKRILSSIIAMKLIEQGVTLQAMIEVSRTRYYLKDWQMDAESMAELLDACGRMSTQGTGIAMCIGSNDDLLKAVELKDQYSKNLIDATLKIDREGIKELENLQYFDSTETGLTGVLCHIVMYYIGKPSKPTIGIHRSSVKTKLSGRATYELLDRGVDLSLALSESTKIFGGEGGGHNIASGGSIKPGTEEDFIKNLNMIIGDQLSSARSR
ncbi:MAG: DHH family phosphoesterase [archaeon]|nr:DHH family phosphoesterase [archaeon]